MKNGKCKMPDDYPSCMGFDSIRQSQKVQYLPDLATPLNFYHIYAAFRCCPGIITGYILHCAFCIFHYAN